MVGVRGISKKDKKLKRKVGGRGDAVNWGVRLGAIEKIISIH